MRSDGTAAARTGVGPEIVHGIEINPLAAELARTTIWIGDIQWGLRNGIYARPSPILRKLDAIECRDALITAVSSPPPGGGRSPREARRVGGTARRASEFAAHPTPAAFGRRPSPCRGG